MNVGCYVLADEVGEPVFMVFLFSLLIFDEKFPTRVRRYSGFQPG